MIINTARNDITLTYCTAIDKINGQPVDVVHRDFLLNLNGSARKLDGSSILPGFVPLYIGMPVILRERNLSTELGITNGAQGFVRQIITSPATEKYSFSKVVIVEFPNSKIHLSGQKILQQFSFPLGLG